MCVCVCVCVTVGGWKASIGRWDWDRQGSEQWGLSWLCEPPQGELCQIVNVSQTSGKWGAGLFTAEEKKWRIYRGEGNSNMGFLLFAMAMWKSHATKGHVAWDLYPKFISLPPPEFLQTTSHSLAYLLCHGWEVWRVDLLEGKCEVSVVKKR